MCDGSAPCGLWEGCYVSCGVDFPVVMWDSFLWVVGVNSVDYGGAFCVVYSGVTSQ